jgi:hypothetical protein
VTDTTTCRECLALNSLDGVVCTNCGALQYTGSCYIAIVGSEIENGICRDSIEMIQRRAGDEVHFVRATKGFEARQMHLNNWYENSKHPFILFLDHDMIFPHNTLERLRSWQVAYISGAYMRRRYAPMAPVWFEYGQPGVMPLRPFTGIYLKDQLYKIGASGWGCVLMHRDVVTATRPLLKGEKEIIEDDMDIYPYDLKQIMKAIKVLDRYVDGFDYNQRQARLCVDVLKDEIRPLRALKDNVGSDIRFPFFARLAGYDMYLDTGVLCDHMLNYPLSPNDYINQSAANVRDVTLAMYSDGEREISTIQKALAEL